MAREPPELSCAKCILDGIQSALDVAYEVAGSGDPLLLVSGFGQVGRRWRRVVPLLTDTFQVVTFDNRETGGTGPCEEGFLLADIATDALDLMSRLGHERFFLSGISMGGMISQEIIRLAPERVRAAVLFSTHGGLSNDPVPPKEGLFGTGSGNSGFNWARLAGPGFAEAHPDIIDEENALSREAATQPMGYARQLIALQQFDPGDAVRDSGVAVVVAHGDKDPLVRYENGVRLAKRLGVELVTYEGAGHVLESERPNEMAELMRRHFAGQ